MTPPAESTGPRWLAPLFIVVLALIGAGAGVWAGRVFLSPAPPGQGAGIAAEGDLAPEIWLRDISGHPQSLSALRGRPLLINFWATWCPPCVKELPLLADLHARRDGDGLAVLTIAQEDDPATVAAFLGKHGQGLPAWMDPPAEGDASKPFGNTRNVLPYSVLLDADGRVLKRKAGAFNEAELREWASLARGP